MAANAPYYQLRGQFTHGANAHFAPDDHDHDHDYALAASLAPQNAALYGESQPPDHQSSSGLAENHHFVELLEAATTAAAGQAAEGMNVDRASAGRPTQPTRGGKRKRHSSPATAEGDAPPTQKRARHDDPTDPQLPGSGDHAQDGSTGSLLSEMRAAGVHSAAALFRPTSKEPSRKYTRPPMSKLFMSLQLTPENFLHLQAQAKAYMLDPAHPDRQSCVGNRGKGDTDMVKLRLFNCVRAFLAEGAGEHFFGEHAEKPAESETIDAARALGEDKAPAPEAKLVWPEDGNKIVTLVTPLLRRMVTNERQRMYAIETRKGGTKRKEGSVEASQDGNPSTIEQAGHGQQLQSALQDSHTSTQDPPPSQYSHPTTPISSVAVPRFSTPVHHICPQLSVRAPSLGSATDDQTRRLPTRDERPFDLRKIFVFLTKDGVKLEQMVRIHLDGPVVAYPWEDLLAVVWDLVRAARAMYPQLRPESTRPITAEQLHEQLKGMAPESLQGLAIAATEMQSSAAAADTNANGVNSPTGPSMALGGAGAEQPQSPPLLGSEMPFLVKAMLTKGLTAVESAEEWTSAVDDVGRSVWAAGRITVVVEMV
ncbi:hypothetical protein K491DRAFT_691734 [Lophiostoma macrostomum CBS 122681]|uniref:Uncharacterized protein n=1 Tax=Lophiostoma macrostomum CBS 122681 TaxID=1314788 RepID=A0A6A6TBR3_9PLEO|nr:hypothetical protein K491DRAFT_691734 [Lophiostoma macrostomum CBS 122681]